MGSSHYYSIFAPYSLSFCILIPRITPKFCNGESPYYYYYYYFFTIPCPLSRRLSLPTSS